MYLGDDTAAAPSSWVSDITNALTQIAPAALQTVSQQKLISANLDRAKLGLPPLDISTVTPGMNIGLSSDTQKFLMYAGGAALAIFAAYLLMRSLKR
jgi:hypothetical protein